MSRPFVLDTSRLVWRLWSGRLPTGIDRVCLAYARTLADRSLAMLQFKGRRVVLGAQASDTLHRLLLQAPGKLDRKALARLLGWALPCALLRSTDVTGKIYLNVGHTGLDDPALPLWLARKGLRPVHLIHDLIPLTHPHYCRAGEAAKHARRMRHALQSAHGIIGNSAETVHSLAAFAAGEGLAMPPALVAHLGIERLADTAIPAPIERPYFLSIGTIEARKNHALLLRTWDRLRERMGERMGERTPDLVLIGQRGWEAEETFALLDAARHEHGRIRELSRCSDAQLAGWIDGAQAVLMPSHVEGFGLPVLEALARGTPVIATDLPVYREIAGGLVLLIPGDDEEAWLAAIADCSSAGPVPMRLRAALSGYAPPTWEDHFAQVMPWLATLGSEPG